jgi:CMP-N-acetylneuraminic acid synthetase
MRNICIIPARGGSKRLPRKNILTLVDKPLIAYTIIAAIESEVCDKIVVSTEDDEIAKVAKNYGAEVIKRPKTLAEDHVKVVDVVYYTLKSLPSNTKYDILTLLLPTSPLRNSKHIREAVNLFIESKADSLVSVTEYPAPPFQAMIIENGYLKPLFDWKYLRTKTRAQDYYKAYYPNGAIYITYVEKFLKVKNFFIGNIIPYIMNKIDGLDIDEYIDFKLAEYIIKSRNFEKPSH